MKFTKFIPLALVLTMAVVPAFALGENGTRQMADEFSLTLPEYFNITHEGDPVVGAGTVTIGANMSTLSWSNTMGVTYNVVNNKHGKTFYLKATNPTTATTKAFATAFGTPAAEAAAANTIKIAFANTNAASTDVPTQEAVNDALAASPTPATNKNVFATTLNLAAVTPTDGGNIVSRNVTSQEIVYVIDEGSYQFAYTMDKAALASTFSPHDEAGIYKATLTITDGSGL